MGQNEKIPQLQEAIILCPECESIQDAETERKGDSQFINCKECNSRWEVFFDFQEERFVSKRGNGNKRNVINEKTMPTKEPVPLEKERYTRKTPGFGKRGPFGSGGRGGPFGSGGSGGRTGF